MIKDIFKYLKMYQLYLGYRIYIIYFLGLIAAFFEGLGILMLLPLLESLDNINSLSNEGYINKSINFFIDFFGMEPNVLSILMFITVAFIIKGFITFLSLGFNAYLKGILLFNLKENLFNAYNNMKYSYYSKRDTGYFSNIINEQPIKGLEAFNQIIILGGHFVNSIVLLSLAFIMTWLFGIMAIVSGIIMLILFLRLNSFVRHLSRITAHENGILTKWLIQSLHGFKYLISTSQFNKIRTSVLKSIKILTNNQIKTGYAAAFTQSVREPIAVLFIMGIIYVQIFILNQKLEPILVSVVLFYRALNSVLAVQSSFQGTFQHIGSMELVDNEFKNQINNKEKNGEEKIKSFSKSIVFKDISFNYIEDKIIIDKISIDFPYLKSIGLVGASGSGKSTILDLITLINKPSAGKIFIDNVDSSIIEKNSWRRQIGYVSQDTVIFDDTIANNISMWAGDYNNDDDIKKRIINAAKEANIFDFIQNQELGFNSVVGDRGVLLSGGQKQRLFIARELFRKPKLLLLDEATSALDSESEKIVQESIDNLKGKITTIIVAHRLSTLKNVDEIYVVDNGKIIEKGNFNKLISDSFHFKKLAKLQQL
tara:strand:+ start:4187 stop:5974 length:1788 start_codon:yes stop_codon:yes gene_type:complete